MNGSMRTTAIFNIQRYLRQLSYFEPKIPAVPIDGIYDTTTRDAVGIFQEMNGLPSTGVVDRDTFDRLYLSYIKSLEELTPPERIDLFPRIPANYEIDVGDELFAVYAVQHMLNELGIIYDYIGQQTINGIYSAENSFAVKQFQLNNGLPESGRVDRATWNALTREHNRYTETHYQ